MNPALFARVIPGRRLGLVAVLAALLLIAAPLANASAAGTSSTLFTGTAVSSAAADVAAIVDAAPASASLTAAQRAELTQKLTALGQLIAEENPTGTTAKGTLQPDWYVGLGWYIYLHHLTPADQRWFLEVGVGVVAAAICAATDGAACPIAAIAAAVIIPTISEYYTPTYCLEIQLTYSGYLHKVYRTSC